MLRQFVPLLCAGLLSLSAGPVLAADVDMPVLRSEAYVIPAGGIDEQRFVVIGGVEQWVTIRGHDRANPVILVLGSPGGGPGFSNAQMIQAFLGWERDFTVVLWDPRGVGKTFARAGSKMGPDVTLDRIVADGLELSDRLTSQLGKQKIALLASSYGSTVGLKMIAARPERFSVFASAGLTVDGSAEREQYFHRRLVELATAARDEAGLKDLTFSGWKVWDPGDDPQKRAALIRVYRRYRPPIANYRAVPPNWTLGEISAARAATLEADEKLLPQWKAYDFTSLGSEFRTPIVVLQGEEDRFNPTPYARAWYEKVKAPSKAFASIPGAGNHVMETHPAEFLALLKQHVRPLAVAP